MRLISRLTLGALLLLALASPGWAESTQPTPKGWQQTGATVTLATTTTTANVQLGWVAGGLTYAPPLTNVCNAGAADAFVVLGGSGVVATTAGVYVPQTHCIALATVNSQYIAGITASGTTTLYIMSGAGTPLIAKGGGPPGALPPGLGFYADYTSGKVWQAGSRCRTIASCLTVTRASIGTAADSNGNWTSFAANTPRITNLGLTVEESRTNILTQTQTMGVAPWQGSNSVVAAPTITAGQASPDGGTNAVRLVYPAVSVSPNFSLYTTSAAAVQAASSTYTGSVFLKGNAGGEQIYLSATPDAVTYVRQRVTLTTSWQRFQISWTTASASYFFGWGADLRDASQTSTPAQTIFAWQPQIELGTFATTPIPTTAAAVTRAADVVTLTTVPTIGSNFSTFASGTPEAPTSYATNQLMLSVSDGTNGNRASFLRLASTGQSQAATAGTAGTVANFAFNGALNTQPILAQSALAKASAAMTGASGMTAAIIGARSDGQLLWDGTIAGTQLYPATALTAAQLQAITM